MEVYFAEDCGIDEFEETFALLLAAVRPGDAVTFKNYLRLIAISNSSTPDIAANSLNLDVLIARSAP